MKLIRPLLRTASLLIAVALTACGGMAPQSLPAGVQETPLPSTDFSTEQLDPRYWNAAVQDIQERGLRIDQMAVMVNGRLLAQHHRAGFNERTLHDLRSVTKSVTSLLVGIAVDQGLLPGIDLPLRAGLASSSAASADLTLRHLLTMRSGLDCDDWRTESAGQEDKMYRSGDWMQFFLALPSVHAPGQQFSYCTGGVVALGEVVARAAGEPLPRFARRVLFEPLGIAGEVWAEAPKQLTDAGGHLQLTLPAMLKLGELMRNGGHWSDRLPSRLPDRQQGRSIVSSAWVQASITSSGAIDPRGQFTQAHMGYLWWLEPLSAQGIARSFQARGNGGQAIIVLPEFNMVVAFTGHAYNAPPAEALVPFQLVAQHLVPMVRRVPFNVQ